MANGSSRVLAVILALLIGALAGWFIATQMPQQRAANGGPLHAQVGPTACDVLPKRSPLSKKVWNSLIWTTKGTAKKLYIEFEVPSGKPQPFLVMYPQPNGRYRVSCNASRCDSGAINPDVPDGTEYKYWQLLDDGGEKPEECDGMIIIDK